MRASTTTCSSATTWRVRGPPSSGTGPTTRPSTRARRPAAAPSSLAKLPGRGSSAAGSGLLRGPPWRLRARAGCSRSDGDQPLADALGHRLHAVGDLQLRVDVLQVRADG